MADLQNTLSGQSVQSGFDELMQGLPPEALEAARKLLSVSSAPTPDEQAAAQSQVESAYAPLLAQLQNEAPPSPAEVPQEASPFNQFAAMLAANLAGNVNPRFMAPTYDELANQKQAAAQTEAANTLASEKFKTEHTRKALELAADMTKASISQAQKAGDDRAATQKAIQLAKINSELTKQRRLEEIGATGKEQRETAQLRIREGAKAAIKLKTTIKQTIDGLDLSTAGKMRLRANTEFLSDFVRNASRPDPMTGEAEMTVSDALSQAQTKFDDLVQDQLAKEGKSFKNPGATDTTKAAGGLLGGSSLDRVRARVKQLEAGKK